MNLCKQFGPTQIVLSSEELLYPQYYTNNIVIQKTYHHCNLDKFPSELFDPSA